MDEPMIGDDPRGPVPIRPLELGEILDAAIKLVRQNMKRLAVAMLLITVPLQVVSVLIELSTTEFCDATASLIEECDEGTRYASDDAAELGGIVGYLVLAALSFVLTQVAAFRILAAGYLGETATIGESLRFGLRRAHSVIWIGFLTTVGATLALFLFIAPGVYLYMVWVLAYAVLFVEGLRGRKALRRSRELVKDHFWRVFGTVLIAQVIAAVATSVAGVAILGALLFGVDEGGTLGLTLYAVFTVAIEVLTKPFTAAVVVLLYFDLRIRKEGFDLALAAERLGGEDAMSPRRPGARPQHPIGPAT